MCLACRGDFARHSGDTVGETNCEIEVTVRHLEKCPHVKRTSPRESELGVIKYGVDCADRLDPAPLDVITSLVKRTQAR